MKYPLIEKLGLKWHNTFIEKSYGVTVPNCVLTKDLEALLEKAQTVWGYVGEHGNSWTSHKPGTFIQENNTHTALLIGIEPLKRGVTKAEILAILRGEATGYTTLANRIESEGICE